MARKEYPKDPKPDDLIALAQEQFKQSEDGSDYNREWYEEDITFGRLGEQWPEEIEQQRIDEDRPVLTINKIPAFIRQVVNDARQNKPGIEVSPVDNGADDDTANVIQGIVKQIERRSNADVAYDTALDNAVSGGMGFFRLSIDYIHPLSFEKEISIDRIPNALQVHYDTNSTEFDASDWDFGFISEFYSEDEFEKAYPGAAPIDFEGDPNDHSQLWLNNGGVRVAEWWSKEKDNTNLLLLSDGNTILEDLLMDDQDLQAVIVANGIEIVGERETTINRVVRRLISGAEVLEEDDWPGQNIPICPVWGEEVIADGRRRFLSMIRFARDPQMMFNYWRSATTELVALAPKAPWIGPEGFVPEGQEDKWETANSRSYSYLEFDPNAGEPKRQHFAGIPAGALQEALNSSDDMKAIIGIYDASLGARSNETSGRAIMARQREGDVSNFHFIDNLSRAIRYGGRCIVECIPHVYKAREVLRILGDDEKESVVRLTTGKDTKDEQGNKLYNLSTGIYDVSVKAGPSMTTQREETREVLIEIMRNVPNAAPYLGDVLMTLFEFPGANKLAERLKFLLPPEIQKAEAQEEVEGMTPEIKGAFARMSSALEQAQQIIQAGQQKMQQIEIENKTLQDAAKAKDIEKRLQSEVAAVEKARQSLQAQGEKLSGQTREADLSQQVAELALRNQALEIQMEGLQSRADEAGVEVPEVDEAKQMMAAGLAGIAEAIRMAAEASKLAAAPRAIVRDENGEIIGAEPIIPE